MPQPLQKTGAIFFTIIPVIIGPLLFYVLFLRPTPAATPDTGMIAIQKEPAPVQQAPSGETATETKQPVSTNNPPVTLQPATKAITDAIATDIQTWHTYTSPDGHVTFRYPLALWPENATFPHNEDMGSFTQSRTDWEQAIGPERLKQYTAVMKGNGLYQYSSDSETMAQEKYMINGIDFLVGIDFWVGGCTLHYDADQKSTHIEFAADICHSDLPFLAGRGSEEPDPKLSSEEAIQKNQQRQKETEAWAREIVKGTTTDPYVLAKQQALLKIIGTITVK